MNCRSCADDLTAYLDGELPSGRREEIAAHLRACGSCGRELAELELAAAFVGERVATLEPGPQLWNNLRARITALPAEPGPAWMIGGWPANRWLAALGGLAAAAAVVAALWGYLGYRESERSLQRYMASYIEQRGAILEPASVFRSDAAIDPLINPFARMQTESFENPFRSEER